VVGSDRVIPPGKQGTATLEVQTVSQLGEIQKPATLYTNDPARPAIVFTLIANVIKGAPLRPGKHIGPIFLSPGSQAGLFAYPGKKTTTEFSITAGRSPVKVMRVEGETSNFAARVQEIETAKSYKIIVESLPTERGGLYKDRLRVITDSEMLPAFTIDLILRVY
jgi:hypothetical protein